MPWPDLDQPIGVQFADPASESVSVEFPNRLALGESMKRNVTKMVTMVLLRDAVDRDAFIQMAHRSGATSPKPLPEPERPAKAITVTVETPAQFQSAQIPSRPEIDVIGTMRKLVDGILTGDSLDDERRTITRFIANQEERAQVFSNLRLTHEFDRLTRKLSLREHLERQLHSAALRGDLNPSELLALMMQVNADIESATRLVRGRAQTTEDVTGLLEKVDARLQAEQEALANSDYAKRTPYGREIARRLLHKLQKLTMDKAAV